jgi:hypothetical protein
VAEAITERVGIRNNVHRGYCSLYKQEQRLTQHFYNEFVRISHGFIYYTRVRYMAVRHIFMSSETSCLQEGGMSLLSRTRNHKLPNETVFAVGSEAFKEYVTAN